MNSWIFGLSIPYEGRRVSTIVQDEWRILCGTRARRIDGKLDVRKLYRPILLVR
jgi:hypothetical protein